MLRSCLLRATSYVQKGLFYGPPRTVPLQMEELCLFECSPMSTSLPLESCRWKFLACQRKGRTRPLFPKELAFHIKPVLIWESVLLSIPAFWSGTARKECTTYFPKCSMDSPEWLSTFLVCCYLHSRKWWQAAANYLPAVYQCRPRVLCTLRMCSHKLYEWKYGGCGFRHTMIRPGCVVQVDYSPLHFKPFLG